MADRHPSLRAYLAGALVARTGDDMAGPALLLAALARTGSATGASSLLAAVTVSAAVGGPVLGALLDRAARPGRLLAGALLLYAAGLAVILGGLGRVPFAVTLLVAVVAGLLGPALSGGWTAQLPRAVPGERLPRANALDAMTFGVAGLAGPALAGGVAEASGASTAVVVAAVMAVGVAEGPQLTALFAVRHREAPDRLRSQVFTTGASLKITGFAMGAAAAGPLAGWSLPGALLVAAGTAALAAPAFFAVRTADRPARPARPVPRAWGVPCRSRRARGFWHRTSRRCRRSP
ncbi:MFS transporter [Streptomyces cyaneofuscatus]|uniref:MFS transporter n=1 Tax=Streptomyces cyaneofuscatus TaxID=66883 RepID=UPI0036DDF91B